MGGVYDAVTLEEAHWCGGSWICLVSGSIRLILLRTWSSCDGNIVSCVTIVLSELTPSEKDYLWLHVQVKDG